MDLGAFAESTAGKLVTKALGMAMESRFRYKFFEPTNILKGANDLSSKSVLEIGCGTGYFTIPAARLIGEKGSLVAIDVVQRSIELVSSKVQAAGLTNVKVVKTSALETGLDAVSFDTVLLFGVIPAPMLPLNILLPEMHRVLKPKGYLAVWPQILGWFPGSIVRSGLFEYLGKRNGVYNFLRVSSTTSQ